MRVLIEFALYYPKCNTWWKYTRIHVSYVSVLHKIRHVRYLCKITQTPSLSLHRNKTNARHDAINTLITISIFITPEALTLIQYIYWSLSHTQIHEELRAWRALHRNAAVSCTGQCRALHPFPPSPAIKAATAVTRIEMVLPLCASSSWTNPLSLLRSCLRRRLASIVSSTLIPSTTVAALSSPSSVLLRRWLLLHYAFFVDFFFLNCFKIRMLKCLEVNNRK